MSVDYAPLPTSVALHATTHVSLFITTHISQIMHHYPCQSDSYQQEKANLTAGTLALLIHT